MSRAVASVDDDDDGDGLFSNVKHLIGDTAAAFQFSIKSSWRVRQVAAFYLKVRASPGFAVSSEFLIFVSSGLSVRPFYQGEQRALGDAAGSLYP